MKSLVNTFLYIQKIECEIDYGRFSDHQKELNGDNNCGYALMELLYHEKYCEHFLGRTSSHIEQDLHK